MKAEVKVISASFFKHSTENTINFDKYVLIHSPVPAKCVNMIIWIHNLFTAALNEKIIQKSFFSFFSPGIIVPLYIPKCPDMLNNITFHGTSYDAAG